MVQEVFHTDFWWLSKIPLCFDAHWNLYAPSSCFGALNCTSGSSKEVVDIKWIIKWREAVQTQGRKHCYTKKWSHHSSHKDKTRSSCRWGYLAFRNSDGINLVEITNMAKKEGKSFDLHCWRSVLPSVGWLALWGSHTHQNRGGTVPLGTAARENQGWELVHRVRMWLLKIH